ncbi:MAG TPA: DUF1810 domain-containing protein [Cellvibrio sp.]
MNTDEFNLSRFIDAQDTTYRTALGEIHAGRKYSHWIWYVFPQLKGLGSSHTANFYGLDGLAEARAYLRHPLLVQRLREAIAAMLIHRSSSATAILGELDALKFRSCLTLFSLADPSEKICSEALQCFFSGNSDPQTIRLLKTRGDIEDM